MISVFKLALELWDASLSLQKQWDNIICPEFLVVIKSWFGKHLLKNSLKALFFNT